MDRNTALLWSWLNVLTKRRYDAIREVYGDLESSTKHVSEEFLRGLGCKEETARETLMRMEAFDAEMYEKDLAKRSLTFLTIEDSDYPSRLHELPDPPIFLYARGDLAILEQPLIALVGTREISAYGRRVVQEFTPAFVSAGMVTVSGLAAGIDAEVAVQTIKSGGRTVAVLGHGLGMIFPQSNTALAKEIVEEGGLLLTEFALDISPGKFTFPARNRIIAGLGLGTVVLEAGEGSGAIITADLALEYGRDVFAVPGQIFDPHYAGCHGLITKGHAKLVTTPQEVLEEIGVVTSTREVVSSYTPTTPDEEAVFAALTTMPQQVDDVVERTGLDAPRVGVALTMMEIAGAAKNVGGGMWVKG
ncbi:MAG: DNA-processing protein DprA [Candidatus Peregrinibacteria bacterium]|nr:DNA-processing protein DprA [Candidatus Peregrinibacteria bacterium]